MPYACAGDARLYYEIQGEGPPVTFLMGFGAPIYWWFPQLPVFAERHRVLALDARGIGKSVADDTPVTMSTLASDVVAVLDHAGVARTDLVGLSFGGMVAQRLALDWPDRVNKLVLCNTNVGGAHAVQPDGDTISRLLGTLMLEDGGDADSRLDILGPTLFPKSYLDSNRQRILALLETWQAGGHTAGQSILMRQMEAVMGHDTYLELPRVPHETLIVTAEEDVLVPTANADVLAARMARARVVRLAGAGHCAHIQVAEAFNGAVLAFLDS